MKLIISSWFEFEADAPALSMTLSSLSLELNLNAWFVSEANYKFLV